jgi:hypothetical protein
LTLAEFLDFDPVTGITHYFDYDEATGDAKIRYVQDVQPIVDYCKALANDGGTDQGIKEGWWLYAKIPAVVQVHLKIKGIDINDPSATKRIIEEINTHFPHLKTTQKVDGGKLKQIYLPE